MSGRIKRSQTVNAAFSVCKGRGGRSAQQASAVPVSLPTSPPAAGAAASFGPVSCSPGGGIWGTDLLGADV